MKFTFGIITFDNQEDRVASIIKDIKSHSNEPEIIVVGGSNKYESDVIHIAFDETVKRGWITRKKNLVTENSTRENIVYMHDYYTIDSSWQKGWEEFGNDWDVCMNVIKNCDGSRYRDWCAWDDPELCYFKYFFSGNPSDLGGHFACLVPYDYKKTEHMYISGGYWLAKKRVMEKIPQDENLLQSQSEDVDWSKRMRNKCSYKMNTNVNVHVLKTDKDLIIPTVEQIEACRKFARDNNIPNIIKKEDVWLL